MKKIFISKILVVLCFVGTNAQVVLPKEYNTYLTPFPRSYFHTPSFQVDSLKDGYWVQFYQTRDGSKRVGSVWQMEKGKIIGKESRYNYYQKIDMERYYRDGKRFAEVEYFYENGAKKDSTIYSNNKEELYLKTWYPNGQVRIDASWLEQKTYYENGQMQTNKKFDESGRLDGEALFFDSKGKVKYKGKWVNGNPTEDQFYKGRKIKFDKLRSKLKYIIKHKAV